MMLAEYKEISPAKINLFLKIISKRDDGYHNLRSGITLINLYDEVLAEESSAFKVKYIGKFAPKNEIFENCIVEKIFSKFDLKKPNYCFTIKKNIPIQSGLGSASSNAAAVIRILKKLNYKKLNTINFSEIAKVYNDDILLNDTVYLDTTVLLHEKYYYFIRSVGIDGSQSNSSDTVHYALNESPYLISPVNTISSSLPFRPEEFSPSTI